MHDICEHQLLVCNILYANVLLKISLLSGGCSLANDLINSIYDLLALISHVHVLLLLRKEPDVVDKL